VKRSAGAGANSATARDRRKRGGSPKKRVQKRAKKRVQKRAKKRVQKQDKL
jgi:hypothetical protein